MTTATRKPPLHPRHDYAFADRLANDLLQHFGEWRALPSLYAPGVPDRCEIVRDVIVRLKRLGFLVEGDRRLGYRLTGFHGFRYVHVVKAPTAPVEAKLYPELKQRLQWFANESLKTDRPVSLAGWERMTIASEVWGNHAKLAAWRVSGRLDGVKQTAQPTRELLEALRRLQ